MTAEAPVPAVPRILVVDDEPLNRQLIEVILAAEGYELRMASSGEEALDIIGKSQWDLILLDIMMPGIDGYQVVARAKANPATASIPIVLLTALDDASSRAHGLRAGAADLITKPVNRAELVRCVASLIASPSEPARRRETRRDAY